MCTFYDFKLRQYACGLQVSVTDNGTVLAVLFIVTVAVAVAVALLPLLLDDALLIVTALELTVVLWRALVQSQDTPS